MTSFGQLGLVPLHLSRSSCRPRRSAVGARSTVSDWTGPCVSVRRRSSQPTVQPGGQDCQSTACPAFAALSCFAASLPLRQPCRPRRRALLSVHRSSTISKTVVTMALLAATAMSKMLPPRRLGQLTCPLAQCTSQSSPPSGRQSSSHRSTAPS